MTTITEDDVEQASLSWLSGLGWQVITEARHDGFFRSKHNETWETTG